MKIKWGSLPPLTYNIVLTLSILRGFCSIFGYFLRQTSILFIHPNINHRYRFVSHDELMITIPRTQAHNIVWRIKFKPNHAVKLLHDPHFCNRTSEWIKVLYGIHDRLGCCCSARLPPAWIAIDSIVCVGRTISMIGYYYV